MGDGRPISPRECRDAALSIVWTTRRRRRDAVARLAMWAAFRCADRAPTRADMADLFGGARAVQAARLLSSLVDADDLAEFRSCVREAALRRRDGKSGSADGSLVLRLVEAAAARLWKAPASI